MKLISFGYRHELAPEADLTFDARRCLYDPAFKSEMLEKTGLDEEVQSFVFRSPIARRAVAGIIDLIYYVDTIKVIAIGCNGGRHRSVAMVERIIKHLRLTPIEVEHRDIDKPLLAPKIK